jgi:hypothetical protein
MRAISFKRQQTQIRKKTKKMLKKKKFRKEEERAGQYF